MKIEKYLILNKYFLSLFGTDDFKFLQQKLKDAPEKTDIDGKTYFVNVLRSLDGLKIPEVDLLRYDTNIQRYVKNISYGRGTISLKYFQYLAVLFTEIFFDYYKNRKQELIYELNQFLRNYDDEDIRDLIDEFKEEDLKKIAFWMATGSGKTLIAHINYYQFFHYKLFNPDNILFITPNEGLSKQHFDELQRSRISARMYSGSLDSGLKKENEVLVIEMTKFVEEKKGGGVTLPVDTFEGKNLVFVDEGHKGKKAEEQKWAKLRESLAKNGFVFEYSATFGQILSEKNRETLREYSKGIIFDYSYKYFYLDGYGKDFNILNVKESRLSDERFQETMFVANLLSFYEQMLFYEDKTTIAKEHNIEKPLWIFVGTTVTGKEEESDVLQIVKFISMTIGNREWLSEKIENILEGRTGLKDANDKDVFERKFEILRSIDLSIEDIYTRIFNGKGVLKIYEIKNAPGELGLRISENPYFGVINIGDISRFKKLLEQNGFTIEQDVISGSLFDNIKKEDSGINILIGAKKFIEGWDTWRVSSMGLLNIGKGQGPQIIQLFGRGVRLKGKGMSLKRSDDIKIRPLENLNIYGIKADYLNKFLDAIAREEVEYEEIKIPVKPLEPKKWQDLPYLKKDESQKFEEDELLTLNFDEKITFTLDLVPKVSEFIGRERKYIDEEKGEIDIQKIVATADEEIKTISEIMDIEVLNWDRILNEIYDFKIMRGYWNLVYSRETLTSILNNCKLRALPESFIVRDKNDIERIEEIAVLLLKGYIERYYRKRKGRFETQTMFYDQVGRQLPLFVSEQPREFYTVFIDKNKKVKLINEVKKLVEKIDELMKTDEKILPRIYLDNHLYVPILLESKDIDKISPPGLIKSEKKFVVELREYLKNNKEKFSRYDIHLLRNLPKIGIGFHLEWAGFYPDFIMWIKEKERTWTVFLDPKGLHHTKGLDDEKIQFAKNELKEIEKKLNKGIILESIILSDTKYSDLIKGSVSKTEKEKYEENNVLFLEDKNWPEKLFKKIGII